MTNINTDRNAMADAFAKAGIDTTTGDHTGDDREPGHAASPTAAACDAARLYGATPDPDEPDNRPVWDKDGAHRRHPAGLPRPRPGHRTRRLPTRRRTRVPPLGLRQHLPRSGPAPRPRHRRHRSRDARTRTRTGRNRGQGLAARTPHRARTQPRGPARRLREAPRLRRRGLRRRNRQAVAAPTRLSHQPHRQAHLRRHRRTRLHPRPQGPRDTRKPPRRNPRRRRRPRPSATPSARPTVAPAPARLPSPTRGPNPLSPHPVVLSRHGSRSTLTPNAPMVPS